MINRAIIFQGRLQKHQESITQALLIYSKKISMTKQVILALLAIVYTSPSLAGSPSKEQITYQRQNDAGSHIDGRRPVFNYVFSKKEWQSFPWDNTGKARLLLVAGYDTKRNAEGSVISSLTVLESPIGEISIDAYARADTYPPTHDKIIVNMVPSGVSQKACDEHLRFLISSFGHYSATRDESNPLVSYFSAQWMLERTTLVWTCVGLAETNNRHSFIALSSRENTKPFADFLPLRCTVGTRFDDGTVKTAELQVIIDPYTEKVRRVDNTIIEEISDVLISDTSISYVYRGDKSTSRTRISRQTGSYESATSIPSLDVVINTIGSCESFNPKARKF